MRNSRSPPSRRTADLPGTLAALAPALSAWYLRDGDAARPDLRGSPPSAPHPHARARADLGAHDGAGRRGRPRRPRAEPLRPAAAARGVLPSGHRRHARPQLRLPPGPHRGDRLEQPPHAAGARDERLPVGPARRHQRRGPRRQRSRSAADRPAATGSGSRSSSATCSRPATRSSRRSPTLQRLPVHAPYNLTLADTTQRRDRLRRTGPGRRARRSRSPPTTRSRSTGPSTRPRRAAWSAATRSPPPPRTRSSSRRCTRPSSAAASARSTRRRTGPSERTVTYRWPDARLAPRARRLYARHADRQTPGACRPPRRRWSSVTSSPRRTSGSRC